MILKWMVTSRAFPELLPHQHGLEPFLSGSGHVIYQPELVVKSPSSTEGTSEFWLECVPFHWASKKNYIGEVLHILPPCTEVRIPKNLEKEDFGVEKPPLSSHPRRKGIYLT